MLSFIYLLRRWAYKKELDEVTLRKRLGRVFNTLDSKRVIKVLIEIACVASLVFVLFKLDGTFLSDVGPINSEEKLTDQCKVRH